MKTTKKRTTSKKTGKTIRVVMDVQIENVRAFNKAAKTSGDTNGLDEGETPKNPLYEILADLTTASKAGIAIVDYASFSVPDDRQSVTVTTVNTLGVPYERIIGH